jgi:hypothetical protein
VVIKAVAAQWPELLPLMNDEKQMALQSPDFKKAIKQLRDLPDDPLYAEYSKLKKQLPNGIPIVKARPVREASLIVEPPAKRLRTIPTINNFVEANVSEAVLQAALEPLLQPSLQPSLQPQANVSEAVLQAALRPVPEVLSSMPDVRAMLDSANNQWHSVLLMTERLYDENATLREHNARLQENLTLTETQLHELGKSEGARADIVVLENLNTRLQEELLALQNKCSIEAKERAASEQRMLEIMTMHTNRFNLSLPLASPVPQPLTLPTGILLNPDPSAFVAELSSFLKKRKTPGIRRADGALLLAMPARNLFQDFQTSWKSFHACPSFQEFKDVMKNSFQFEIWFCRAVTHDGMHYPAGDYFVHAQQSIANRWE